MQRDGINIFCFITLHEERNIQQSLPQRDEVGKGINRARRRDVFFERLGDLKTEKASTDPTHYPDRLRPWAQSIGLQGTALSHLYTHRERERQATG